MIYVAEPKTSESNFTLWGLENSDQKVANANVNVWISQRGTLYMSAEHCELARQFSGHLIDPHLARGVLSILHIL